MSRPSPSRRAALLLLLLAAGCGRDAAAPPGEPGDCRGPQDLQSCLPSWQTYAPTSPSQPPTETGTPVVTEVTEDLERYDDTGALVNLGDVTFVCTDRTYSFTENPEKALSFGLDRTVIWPGALIQGESHRDGNSLGGLLELPIRERAPISVFLTFNNEDNTRLVEKPDASSVGQALGSMIGNAQANGLATSNAIDFKQDVYSSEEQAAQAFNLSGRYLGFEARANGSITRSATRNVVAAQLVQQMYVAGVTQPATPADFFSSAFTNARYQTHEDLGQIGPDNPPLYVSRVGYGRMMLFAMSAEAEAEEIKGTLRAAWQGIGAGGAAQLSAKQKSILQHAEIRFTQVGGDQGNALAAIRTGTLSDYFTNTAPLTSAEPLWFELKSLTGQVAMVSEAGTYTETTCIPKLPGTFEFRAAQSLAVPFTATQRQVVKADVDGDTRMDLVFNERGNSLNRVHVALGQADGSFQLLPPAEYPEAPVEGWQSYELFALDFNGDGRDDLAWNHLATDNVVYAVASSGGGAWQWGARQVHVSHGWHQYTVATGDMNGDGLDDIVWSLRTVGPVYNYFGFAQPDGTFSMIVNFVAKDGGYSNHRPPLIGHFNSDPYADVVLNAVGPARNDTYVGRFTPTSATAGFLTWTLHQRSGTTFANTQFLVSDIDGQNGDDLIWVDGTTRPAEISRSLNSGNATFAAREPTQGWQIDPSTAYVGDFNDDGRIDILLNHLASDANDVVVGFGSANGDFSFPAGLQKHPATPGVGWGPFDQVFIGDVNGDGKDDVVWTSPSRATQVFVALAK